MFFALPVNLLQTLATSRDLVVDPPNPHPWQYNPSFGILRTLRRLCDHFPGLKHVTFSVREAWRTPLVKDTANCLVFAREWVTKLRQNSDDQQYKVRFFNVGFSYRNI